MYIYIYSKITYICKYEGIKDTTKEREKVKKQTKKKKKKKEQI